ncbi:MAG TPA: glycerophosphodiester phosphodiesterase family protein, partial [Polyangiaceae bacterium]|nr:glycerophosphodiester phosphodiesterase family protein [Polyangiaceae bacterium]
MQTDPVFGLPTPLVFAHRGGAGEVPESTERAFRHAVEVGVDVLEFDLNLTKDGQIVVWHGPKLDNVYVGTELLQGESIENVSWAELANARVVDPRRPDDRDQDPLRKLLLLEDFVQVVQRIESEHGSSLPWNIELKGKLERWESVPGALPELFRQLDVEVAQRKIVLAALRVKDVQRLRQATAKYSRSPAAYASNLAGEEQLPYRKWMRLGPLESLVV